MEYEKENSEGNSGRNTPPELIDAAKSAAFETLPYISKERYFKTYNEFKKWQASKGTLSTSQTVVLAYFHELAKKLKCSTLWSYYSMLKATLKLNENIDIASYAQVIGFLKSKSSGHKPVKARVFKEAEIQKFLDDAPDELWLDVKVVCIFGIAGACRGAELPLVTMKDVEIQGDLLLVSILVTKTKITRSFTLTGQFRAIVAKYIALRPTDMTNDRFFVNFHHGKCTKQVIGKHKFAEMPRRIAAYLNLSDGDRYTGHSFRRTSATILANAGATIETVKRHGGWQSTKTAEGYIDDSIHYKRRTGDLISDTINATRSVTPQSTISENVCVEMVNAADTFFDETITDEDKMLATQADIMIVDDKAGATHESVSTTFNNNSLGGASLPHCILKSLNFNKCTDCKFTFNFK